MREKERKFKKKWEMREKGRKREKKGEKERKRQKRGENERVKGENERVKGENERETEKIRERKRENEKGIFFMIDAHTLQRQS